MSLMMASGCFFLSCDKTTDDTEKTCGDSANLNWDNLTLSLDRIESGNAQFKLEVLLSNICIYKNAEITVHIGETSTSSIYSVSAFVDLRNSTPADISFVHQNDTVAVWKSNPYSLDLRQGFKTNPGDFMITVYVFLQAQTLEEARQKYNASVDASRSYIHIAYYRPKS